MAEKDSKLNKVTFTDKLMKLWGYLSSGIWSDPRRNWWLSVLRTLNLSVNSFLNRDIQTQACAMTYRTMLAVVPALALLVAIGRGFGIQSVIQEELFQLLPAQKLAITYATNFVERYLEQTSEGIFVGVGIVFLLYTLISLLSNVEDTFNYIWGQKQGRTIWRKLSDYTATMLILPILMICASGISLLLSSTLNAIFHFSFMTPVISWLLECASWFMMWLFFTAAYLLIPNTKVNFKNAFISGVFAGTGFMILQWLFVTGTLYVTKYNAIYGSFAFLPLLLLWLQLVWVITLAGAVICYSSQNVFAFNLEREVNAISSQYHAKVTLAIISIITTRFLNNERVATPHDFMDYYDLPARLVTSITDRLCKVGVINRVVVENERDEYGFQLSVDPNTFTVESLTRILYTEGIEGFIPEFDNRFPGVEPVVENLEDVFTNASKDIFIKDIKILNLDDIKR